MFSVYKNNIAWNVKKFPTAAIENPIKGTEQEVNLDDKLFKM